MLAGLAQGLSALGGGSGLSATSTAGATTGDVRTGAFVFAPKGSGVGGSAPGERVMLYVLLGVIALALLVRRG